MFQHGAYTMLMDACYDREIFPTLDQAFDWCWASTEDEIAAVTFVLSKFFTEHDGVFKQRHITEVLEKYHKNAATNKAIAIEREAKKRAESTKREQVVDGSTTNEHLITNKELRTTNQELPTTNHKSRTKVQKKKPVVFKLPDWINKETWQAFVEHRQKLKAPMTIHAKNLMVNRLEKLNPDHLKANDMLNQSISSGWKGVFELKSEVTTNGQNQQDNRSRTQRVNDKLRDIAAKDIDERGYSEKLD